MATRFEFTEDAQFSFGIHDVSKVPPDRIGETYSETHAMLLAAAPQMLEELKACEDVLCGAMAHAPRIRDIIMARITAVRANIAKAQGRNA